MTSSKLSKANIMIQDKRGIGLIEVMVAMGLVAVVAVAGTSLVTSVQKSNQALSSSMDLITLQDEILRTMTSPEICNRKIIPSQSTINSASKFLSIRISTGQTISERTALVGYALKDVTVKISSVEDIPVATGGSLKLMSLSLEAYSLQGFKYRTRELGSLAVLADPSGALVSCGAPQLVSSCPSGYVAVSSGPGLAPTCQQFIAQQPIAGPPPSLAPTTPAVGPSPSTPVVGTTPITPVVATTSNSCAYSQAVCDLYASIGRSPAAIDAGGAAYYQSQLAAGRSPAALAAEMSAIVAQADAIALANGLASSQTLLNGSASQVADYMRIIAPVLALDPALVAAYVRNGKPAANIDAEGATYWQAQLQTKSVAEVAKDIDAVFASLAKK